MPDPSRQLTSTCRVPFGSNTGDRPPLLILSLDLPGQAWGFVFSLPLCRIRFTRQRPPASVSLTGLALYILPIAATRLAMAEISEKKPAGAPSDQPSFAKYEVNADEADIALAAMGYQPVSRLRC